MKKEIRNLPFHKFNAKKFVKQTQYISQEILDMKSYKRTISFNLTFEEFFLDRLILHVQRTPILIYHYVENALKNSFNISYISDMIKTDISFQELPNPNCLIGLAA